MSGEWKYCEDPTDDEKEAGCHVGAAHALGSLGREESLPVLKALDRTRPHPGYDLYAEAMLKIRDRAALERKRAIEK